MRVAYSQKIVGSLYLLSRGLISSTSKIISFRVITAPRVDEPERYVRMSTHRAMAYGVMTFGKAQDEGLTFENLRFKSSGLRFVIK